MVRSKTAGGASKAARTGVNVEIPNKLYRKLKLLALKEETKIKPLVVQLIEEGLRVRAAERKTKHLPTPKRKLRSVATS